MVRVVDRGAAAPPLPGSGEELGRRWSTFQPWLQADPFPFWRELREHAPVVRSEELGGFWVLTRHEDLEWAARHPEIFSNAEIGLPHRQIYRDKLIPIQLDGEDHRVWRQVLTPLFNPASVNRLTPEIRRSAVDAIEPIAARGHCEFVSELAVRVPSEIFLVNFGIERRYLPALLEHKDWLRRVGIPTAKSDEELHEAGRPMWEFFNDALRRRRSAGVGAGVEGAHDIISTLLTLQYQGRALRDDEIVNIILMTMFASLDTTNSMLGLMFAHLAQHPELQRMVAGEPERIPLLIEELVRHQAMVSTARVVVREVELHGVTLRPGDRVLMSWGMAGRDPEVFDRPDEVDLDRANTRHLGFGIGPHRCLGMHLARRIIAVSLQEWHARIPRYELAAGSAGTPHYSPIRGLSRLDLVAVPGAGPAATGR